MDITKLSLLLDKYYSGDILPEEYHTLLSLFKEDAELPPELDAERKMFLAIESWFPSVPKNLENKLRNAIDMRKRKKSKLLRLWYSSVAAVVSFIIIAIGIHYFKNRPTEEYGKVAMIPNSYKNINKTKTTDIEVPGDAGKMPYVLSGNTTSYSPIHDKELDKAAEIVNEALLEVLANINLAEDELWETIENI